MGIDDIEKDTKLPEVKTLKSGLYLVATPIGNLRDITLRALDVLQAADVILCEDTRVTRKLLAAYNIKSKLQVYNDHSDKKRREQIVEMLAGGQIVALVSDAGMPMVSDPGYKLVRDCAEHDLYVTTLPGANAPLSALQLSAFPSDQFCFLGFVPQKIKARSDFLLPWKNAQASLICFESAQRLKATLQGVLDVLGDREVAVVREITKLYEQAKRGRASELLQYYEENGAPKGEIVLVIAQGDVQQLDEAQIEKMLRQALGEMKTKDAAKFVAQETGLKVKDLYDLALRLNEKG